MSMVSPIDFQNPDTYPGQRDEEWKYTNLGHALIPLGDDYKFATHQDISQIQDTQVQWREYRGGGASHSQETIELTEGAHLSRVLVFDPKHDSISLNQIWVSLKPKSHLQLVILATGSQLSRLEIVVDHQGEEGVCEINCAYILNNKNHFDLTTRVNHKLGHGITKQAIKGLVKDQALGVFQGRLIVSKGADGTDARMHHQALLLNDGAKVRAKPELEIYADDVACAHGNTVGTLDEMALFFCQARGMNEAVAKNLLMQAFLVPICDSILDEGYKDKAIQWLNDKTATILGHEL